MNKMIVPGTILFLGCALAGMAGYTIMGKQMQKIAPPEVAAKQPECDKAIDRFIVAHRADGKKEKVAMCSILKIEHPNTRMVYLKGCKEKMEIKCD